MTIILNNTGNPINRTERIKINENWDRIIAGLTDIQFQINVLAGGEEVNEILDAIRKATENAITATQKAEETVELANQAVAKSETATENAKAATADALKAKQDADKATAEALEKIQEVNALIQTTEGLNTESQNKIIEMRGLITQGNNLNTELTTLKNQLTGSVIPDAQQATANANAAYEKIKGWDTATEWKSTVTYSRNNVVTRNGSTFQSKVDNNVNKPPTVTDDNWILLAQRGVDGKGSVASVNGTLPDADGNVTIDVGLLDTYTKSEVDGLIAETSDKFTQEGFASDDLKTVTETELQGATITSYKHVKPDGSLFLPEQVNYLAEIVVDKDESIVTQVFSLVNIMTGKTYVRTIRKDNGSAISDSLWVEGGGGGAGSGGKFVTVPLKLKTTAKNQKKWTIPQDQLDMSTDSVVAYFNTVYLRPSEYTITGSVGTNYVFNYESPESEIADNNIDIIIYKNVPDVNGLISGTALTDGSVGMTKLSQEVKDKIAEAGQSKDAWQKGKFNDVDVINLGNRSVSKTLYIDGIGGGWNGTDNVETLNITIPFDAQFSGIIKATYTTFWGHSESHGGATVTYRVANYADRDGVKQADYIIETITPSFATAYNIKAPVFSQNTLNLPITKSPLGSMPFMIKLEVDGYLGENKSLFDAVNSATCASVDLGSPTAGGYPWTPQKSTFMNSTGGTMTGNIMIEKGIPGITLKPKLNTPDDSKVLDFYYNAAGDNNFGAVIEMDRKPTIQILDQKTVRFFGHDDAWFSIQDLKSSVSDGKAKVASAITGKGVNTASDLKFIRS